MICEPCRKGADYISEIATSPDLTLYQGDIGIAQRWHEHCEGCDCQHKVELQAHGRSVRT